MADTYLGSILYFAGPFAIRGFAFCQGQLLPIAQNTALFSLLGTTYGGDGRVTFGLPDLRGRAPVGQGQGPGLGGVQMGQTGGNEQVTLTNGNLPVHTHAATFTNNGSALNITSAKATVSQAEQGDMLARSVDTTNPPVSLPAIYGPASTTTVALGGLNIAGTVTVGAAGASQPVGIRDPYLGLNPLICTQGIFPSRN